MICKECGAAISDTAKFCNSCGAPVVRVIEEPVPPTPEAEPVFAAAPEAPAAPEYGFGPEQSSPFGSDLPSPAAIFPPAPEAGTETPAAVPEKPEEAPGEPEKPEKPKKQKKPAPPEDPARPARVHTAAGSAALAVALCLLLVILPPLAYLHAFADAAGDEVFPVLSDAVPALTEKLLGLAESPWILAGWGALTAVVALDLWLLNYRRVRRAFSAWGYADVFAGLIVGGCGAVVTSLAPRLPGALVSVGLAAADELRALLLLCALVYLCLGAVCLCVAAVIRVYRRGSAPRTASRPQGIWLLILILNVLALLFCLLCAFLYLNAYVF